MKVQFHDTENPEKHYTLPEMYQPIYGYPESDDRARRNCYDRLETIKTIYIELEKQLQRPLRVLDLGCAQGFFCFHIAKWGGVVVGIDSDEINIKLCNFIANENPDLNVTFSVAKIEEFIPKIQSDEYDLVLGLSIFFDLRKSNELDNIADMMADLSIMVPVCIFEPELINEPFSGAEILPDKYVNLFSHTYVVKVLSRNAVYGDIKRPLCFISNEYIYFNEFGMIKIDEAHQHNFLNNDSGNRLYCFSGDKFIKLVAAWNEDVIANTKNEIAFLKDMGGYNDFPKLYEADIDEDECGTRFFILRDKLEGITLQEKMATGEEIDRLDVIKQVLEQLIFLEKHGYYHSDLLPHNILYDNGKVHVIDYEATTKNKVMKSFPYNFLQLFFMFMNAVFENDTEIPGKGDFNKTLRYLKRHISPQKYYQIAAIKDSENVFAKLYEILFQSEDDGETFTGYTAMDNEFFAISSRVEEVSKQWTKNDVFMNRELIPHINNIFMQLLQQQQKIQELEERLAKLKL